MDRVAGRLRDALKLLPDGSHEAEGGAPDDDLIDYDRPLRIHVVVEKQGEGILFDFSGSDEQARGPVSRRPRSDQEHLLLWPDGHHRRQPSLQPRFRGSGADPLPGRDDVCPRPGAAVSYYVPLAYLASDVVLKALGEFRPEKAVGSAGGGGAIRLLGTASASGKPWMLMELLDTALGATGHRDGVSLIHGTLGWGQFRPGPIEIHETEFPVRITRFDVRPDSGGPGKLRGGPGCTREYQVLEECMMPVRGTKGSLEKQGPALGGVRRPASARRHHLGERRRGSRAIPRGDSQTR